MAVREYIGSRYVPIFGRKDESSIEWDNTKPYEPLTIVLYQGNSYTSRQYVPVGIDIRNELFWAQTGNYNAQVEQYRRDVYTFDDRISDNTSAISSLTPRVTANENAISSLTPRVTANEGEIADLITDVTQLGNVTARHTNQIGTTSTPNTILYDIDEHEDWIRANDHIANVKQFGAVGDGVTDDTAAIQAAINSGYDVYFPSSNNESYLVTDTLICRNTGQAFFSDNFLQGRTIKFRTENQTKPCFKVYAPSSFNNITITRFGEGVNDPTFAGIAIQCPALKWNAQNETYEDNNDNTDVLIENCGFTHFATTIDFEGRGLLASHCQFTSCNIGIRLTWKSFSGSDIMDDTLGHRAHRIIGNRFHSLQNTSTQEQPSVTNPPNPLNPKGATAICICLESDTPSNSVNINGILIAENMVDYGIGNFIYASCGVRYADIVSNYLGYLTQRAIEFVKDVYNTVINGNEFYGNSAFHTGTWAIEFHAAAIGCVISNNTFSNYTNGINFLAGVNSCVVQGNTFNSINRDAITCHGDWNRVVVLGNSGNMVSDADTGQYFINSASSSLYSWNHVKIAYNTVGNCDSFIYRQPTNGVDTITDHNFGDDV